MTFGPVFDNVFQPVFSVDIGDVPVSQGNVYKAWKGAVEPASTSPSGNEVKLWKGAVEPAA